jgi:hypothetical protein
MPRKDATTWLVGEQEWLRLIAKEVGCGVDALKSSNPGLTAKCAGNFDVLAPGWELKLPAINAKDEGAKVSQSNPYKAAATKSQLVVNLQQADGKPLDGKYILRLAGEKFKPLSGQSSGGKIVIPLAEIKPVPPKEHELKTATLRVGVLFPEAPAPHWEEIALLVGGLDPLTESGQPGRNALQKMLKNLGYYTGKIDGDLGSGSGAALRALQMDQGLEVTGLPDEKTCQKIKTLQGNKMADIVGSLGDAKITALSKQFPAAPAQGAGGSPAPCVPRALTGGDDYKKHYAFKAYKPHQNYLERAVAAKGGARADPSSEMPVVLGDETALRNLPLEGRRLFPTEAFVALSEPGDQSTNPNPIRMAQTRFIFVDSGRWLKNGRDFAVVYGWHAYLCEYLPQKTPSTPPAAKPRLDEWFFDALKGRVRVSKVSSAVWASDKDFDWSKLTVVIPDVHFVTQMIGDHWRPNQKDVNGAYYDLQAEIDLLDLAQALAQLAGSGLHMNVIQIGDTYDLWMGAPSVLGHDQPLFTKNTEHEVALRLEQDISFSEGLFSKDKNYAKDALDILARWYDLLKVGQRDPETAASRETTISALDARTHVIGHWIRAIQGYHATPAEALQDDFSAAVPWVKTVIQRRAGHLPKQITELNKIEAEWKTKKLTDYRASQKLQEGFKNEIQRDGRMSAEMKALENEGTWVAQGEFVDYIPPFTYLRPRTRSWFVRIRELLDHASAWMDTERGRYARYVQQKGGLWLNPGEAALRLLAEKCGISYIYGNHDSYLILPECVEGLCPARHRYLEYKGVFIEHANRLEAVLPEHWASTGYINIDTKANLDGLWHGYTHCSQYWQSMASSWWKPLQWSGRGRASRILEPLADGEVAPSQEKYQLEAGRFFAGRRAWKQKQADLKLPHIFVIGHTHAPEMWCNVIDVLK